MQKRLGFIGLLTAILSLPSAGSADTLIRWEPTLDSAQRMAAQTNRPVLIYFWAPWCGVCKRMEAEVLAQPSVAAEIATNYVAVKVNADNFPATAKQYGVAALPTTVLTTPQGQLLVSMQGRVEATEYATRLNQIATGAKQHGAVYAQMPSGGTPSATPATPPTTTAPPAPAQMSPAGTPAPVASPTPSAVNGPALTGRMQPSGANNQLAGTSSGLSDDRYADILRGGQAAPATPIAQPPSSLAGAANTQPPPNVGSFALGAVPPATMPSSMPPATMPTSMPPTAKGLAQGYPPSQPPSAATSPMVQSPVLAAACARLWVAGALGAGPTDDRHASRQSARFIRPGGRGPTTSYHQSALGAGWLLPRIAIGKAAMGAG